LLGWAEFCGLRVAVRPGVFVPRRRTELLVAEAARRLAPGDATVDLCCGSGAIAAALAARVSGIELHAVDIDVAAVACARRNLAGAPVYQGDLFDPLPEALRGRVAVVAANTPYVPTGAIASMPPEARVHEPRVALDGGADGLDLQRRVAKAAPRWLRPGGHLLVETSAAQAERAADVFTDAGLTPQIVRDDEIDATVVIGTS
jgi:release factor glutamine methyltransferase